MPCSARTVSFPNFVSGGSTCSVGTTHLVRVEAARIRAKLAPVRAERERLAVARRDAKVVAHIEVVQTDVVRVHLQRARRVVAARSRERRAVRQHDDVLRKVQRARRVAVDLPARQLRARGGAEGRTVTAPLRLMSTCSLYVPGYMKIACADPSFGSAATAAESVLYGPEDGFTTSAPEGADVRDAARASAGASAAANKAKRRMACGGCGVRARRARAFIRVERRGYEGRACCTATPM